MPRQLFQNSGFVSLVMQSGRALRESNVSDNKKWNNNPSLPYTLKTALSASLIFGFTLSGCSAQQTPCENIVEVNRQIRECQQLKKDMHKKDHPQHALTARKRFDSECVNLRYYRDEYDTICKKNQTPITPVE